MLHVVTVCLQIAAVEAHAESRKLRQNRSSAQLCWALDLSALQFLISFVAICVLQCMQHRLCEVAVTVSCTCRGNLHCLRLAGLNTDPSSSHTQITAAVMRHLRLIARNTKGKLSQCCLPILFVVAACEHVLSTHHSMIIQAASTADALA